MKNIHKLRIYFLSYLSLVFLLFYFCSPLILRMKILHALCLGLETPQHPLLVPLVLVLLEASIKIDKFFLRLGKKLDYCR